MAEQQPSQDSKVDADWDAEDVDDETGEFDPEWFPLEQFFPGLAEEWDKLPAVTKKTD